MAFLLPAVYAVSAYHHRLRHAMPRPARQSECHWKMYHSECERKGPEVAPGEPTGAAEMRAALFTLLGVQVGIALAVAAGFYLHQHTIAAVEAALYGAGIGLVVSLLLGLRMLRAARPGAGVAGLYLGAVERFVFVAAAFAVGLGVLHLRPVALLVGFAAAECAYFIAASRVQRSVQQAAGRRHGG